MKFKDTYRLERSNTCVSSFLHPSSGPMAKLSSKNNNPSYNPSLHSLKSSSDIRMVQPSLGKSLHPRYTHMTKLDTLLINN